MIDKPPADPWEAAYLRFETPRQEIRKFIKRFQHMGANAWPRDAQVLDLFCGRGNGMIALSEMGFTNLHGADLSPRLLREYPGNATVACCDCRRMPFPDRTFDIAMVQGGLHHLPGLPDDLDQTLSEVRRVLRPNGTFLAVEPWSTPFLKLVHATTRVPGARIWSKLDALATMIEHERTTYEQWLSQPELVLDLLNRHFEPQRIVVGWGKLMFLGRPRN